MSKTSFNGKSIGAEDELGIDNIEDIICQTLEVVTSANFLGSVFFTTLELNSIGSYQQTGNVDFNYNDMSNINIVSGSIDGINIGANNPGSGKFTSLQTGIPGTGYQVYFYSDSTGNYFNYDGDNGVLKVTNRSTFGITNPFGFFQVSPVKYSRGKVQISDNQTNPGPGKIIVGNSDVTFPTDIVGYYLVLDDNTKTKIVERLSDKLLTCDGPDSNGEDLQKSEQGYNIYYPGIVIDDYGNLNAGGSGHLTVPSGTTASRSTSAVTGSIRYNTEQNLFEGYTGDKWGSIGGTGSQDNQTKLIFDKFVNDNKVRLVSNNKDTLIVANNGKLNLGYINTYGHLKTSSNKSILNENSISSDLIEEYNININSELVDQISNESGIVGSVTNSSLTFSSQTWGSLSSSAPLYSTNGVPFRLYRNNTSSFDLYGSQSESIGYDNSFYDNLTYSGSGLELNDISIDVNNYNSIMHKEYSIKISSVHGLNDLILNSTNISSNVTLQVLITDTEDIDKFRIKIVGENNFSIVQTNTGQNISLNIVKPSTGSSIGNIDISFTNTTGHVINEIWTIAISNSTFNSISFSNPNIGADKFMWKISSDPNSTYSNDNLVSTQYSTINDGIQIKFNSLTGHTLNNVWTFKVYSKNRITAINNNDIITSNDNIKSILNINDAITLYDNTYKYTYLVKEFISEDDTQQIYKVRLNKNFVGASSTNYKGLYDANLISLHNGYGKTKFRIDRSGNIGVLTSYTDKINTSLYLNTTDAIKIPVGTTEQRPSTNETGYVRYNNTTKYMELYDQNKYVNICTNGAIVSPNLKNKAYITDNNSFIVTINNSSIFNLTKDNVSITVPTSFSSLTDGIMNIVSGTISGVKYFDSAIASITNNLNVSTLSDGVLSMRDGTISGIKFLDVEIASVSKNLSANTLTDNTLTINSGSITSAKFISSNELNVSGDTTINGNLSVAGSFTVIHTDINTSEQISITNDGTGPALIVKQRGINPVMNIMDTNAGGSVNGDGVVTTSGSSSSVTVNSTDYNNISIDAEITANNVIRNVIAKGSNNTITIDSAVDWDNSSAGYSFTYKNPIHALFVKDGGYVGIGTSNPSSNLDVIGIASFNTLTDGVINIKGGTISGVKEGHFEIASVSQNFSVSTLTDGVMIMRGGTISGVKEGHFEIASISQNFSVSTLTDGVMSMRGGTITGVKEGHFEIASVSKNFSISTLTDGVLSMRGGTISGVKEGHIEIASVTKNFSVSTLTDGVMSMKSGTISGVKNAYFEIASISQNLSINTLTDGVLTIYNGTISGVKEGSFEIASVSQNFSVNTLTDGVLSISSGTISNAEKISIKNAYISKYLSASTLTDGILSIERGTISSVNYINTNVASITTNISARTYTDGFIVINYGTISSVKYAEIEFASISKEFTISTLTDGVMSMKGGTISGVKEGHFEIASISQNFSVSTLTDGILSMRGGTISGVKEGSFEIASVSKNFSVSTLTDGVLSMKDGTISGVKEGSFEIASITQNISVSTLTDGVLSMKGGTISGVKEGSFEIASITQNISISTLTDGVLSMRGGTISGVKEGSFEIASITQNISVSTLTDGVMSIRNGTISGVKKGIFENASITGILTASTFYGDGSNLTGLNADRVVKNDTEIVVEDTGNNGIAKFIIDGSEKVRINTSGFVGIGTTNPVVSLDLSTTDALALPSGNTSQRPSNAKNGMIRYNNATYNLEYYNNGWSNVGSSSSGGGGSSITQVGNPSVGTFSSLGYGSENPQISSTNNIPDAFQILDRWIARFLVDTPPPPTLVSSSTTSTKVSISWNNPLQFEVGILNTKVPKINEIKIDYKKSSNSNWTTISTSSTSITSLEFYIEGSGSGVSGNIYKFYTIDKETNYDFRIYGINDNNERTLQYLTVTNLATVGIGVPSEPTNLAGTVNSDTQVTLSYTKPQYNDSVNNTTSSPYIEYYKATINTTNSIRYGGVLSDSRDVLSSIGNNADAPTSLAITNMNPGTTYSLKVAAKNTQNANYGNYSSVITKTTNFPSAPSYLVTSNANNINNSAILRGNYQTSGYSIDGITLRNNIFNINNISNGIETELTSQFRINYNEASTDNIVSIIRAFGGLTSQYNNSNNTSSTNIGGFGISSVVGDYTNGASKLTITEDQEYYGTTKYQGFYKVAKCKAVANNSSNYYVASADSYSLQLQQEVVISGSNNIINTNKVDFYLDSLNSNPVINNLLISDITINNTSNDIKYISGILTYDTSATFKFQFNLENLGDYNLRNDRKHAYLGLYNGSTLISNDLTIYRQNFSSSGSKYYTEPTNKYETSSTLYNTDGYTLTPKQNRENIQINSFTFNMSNINNVYSENVVIKGTPYNLYGTGSTVSASSINTLNGNSMGNIRVDGKSIVVLDNTNSSTGNYGLHVRSGYDSSSLFYPSGPGNGNNDFGDSYDNTVNINSTNNPRYDKELQLINGYYTSYNTYAYKDYSNYYVSSSVPNSYNYPNYSSIYTNEINGFRFVTFKYTNLISNSNGCRITFVNSSGFSSVTPSDISLHIKINNSSSSGYNTGWLNANDAVSGVGVTSSNKNNNGTTCLSISGSYVSTSTLKYCYLPSPTTGDLYIRLGIKIGSNKSISYMSVQNNLS